MGIFLHLNLLNFQEHLYKSENVLSHCAFFPPPHPEGKAFMFVHLTASEPDNSRWSLIKFIYLLSPAISKAEQTLPCPPTVT